MFNKRGFSLAEVMIGVGLMGVVSLGIMQIMKESRKVSKGTGEKIQIEEVNNQIYQLLRDPEVCRSTLFGKDPSGNGVKIDSIIKKNGILDIDVGGGATTDIDGSEMAEYNSKSIADTYIRADCANIADATSKPCTFGGAGISSIFLKDLKILAYGMTHSTSGNSSSPYKNQDGYATVEVTLLKGSAIGKTNTADLDKAKESSYGQLEVVKRFSIPLMVDSSGKISDCKTELRNFSVGACDQFTGIIDTDEKCKDIKIQAILPETTGGPPYKEAITTKGDTQVNNNLTISNTLNIGAVGTNGVGNVNTTDNATIKNKMLITTGKLILGTKSTLQSGAGGVISLYKTAGDNNAVLKLGSGVSVKGFNQNIGIQTTGNPANALEVEGAANISSTLEVEGNLNAKADLEIGGVATFKIVGSTLQLTGVEFELGVGINDSFNATQVSTENDLIAKRKWVYDMFRVQLGDATSIQQVIDELMTYAGATQLTQLRNALCAGMNNAVWTGTQCIIPSANSLCTGGQFLRGFTNGAITCQTINLGNLSVPAGSFMTGFNSGNPMSTTVTTLVTPGASSVANRQESCYGNNRGSSGKYNVIYDSGNNTCTASTWTREYQYKGCGHAAGNDSAGDCNCGSFGSGWYYVGNEGCQYNWVVWGYKCKCARDL